MSTARHEGRIVRIALCFLAIAMGTASSLAAQTQPTKPDAPDGELPKVGMTKLEKQKEGRIGRGVLSIELAKQVQSIVQAQLATALGQKDDERAKSGVHKIPEGFDLQTQQGEGLCKGSAYRQFSVVRIAPSGEAPARVNVRVFYITTSNDWQLSDKTTIPAGTYIAFLSVIGCEVFGEAEKKLLDLNAKLYEDCSKACDEHAKQEQAPYLEPYQAKGQELRTEMKDLEKTIRAKRQFRKKMQARVGKPTEYPTPGIKNERVIKVDVNDGLNDDKKELTKVKRDYARLGQAFNAVKSRMGRVFSARKRRLTELRTRYYRAVMGGEAITADQIKKSYEDVLAKLLAKPDEK
jgi:hypothetical protein